MREGGVTCFRRSSKKASSATHAQSPRALMVLCVLSELEQYRVLPGLDIWVVPDFPRHILGCDAALLQTELERAYGIVGEGDAITPENVVPKR